MSVERVGDSGITPREQVDPQDVLTTIGVEDKSTIKVSHSPPKQPPDDKEQILRYGPRKAPKLILTSTQRVGVWMLAGIGFVIFCVMIFLFIDWSRNAPYLDASTLIGQNGVIDKDRLETLRALNDLALDRASSLFDLFVIRALLPIFTTILGYVFGRQVERRISEK